MYLQQKPWETLILSTQISRYLVLKGSPTNVGADVDFSLAADTASGVATANGQANVLLLDERAANDMRLPPATAFGKEVSASRIWQQVRAIGCAVEKCQNGQHICDI
jgi:hypothetical protein